MLDPRTLPEVIEAANQLLDTLDRIDLAPLGEDTTLEIRSKEMDLSLAIARALNQITAPQDSPRNLWDIATTTITTIRQPH